MKILNLIFCAATLFFLAMSPPAAAQGQAVQVNINKKAPYGQYLTDGEGNSLYLFLRDGAGKSTCYEECAEAWPPLIAESKDIAAGGQVPADKIGTTKRNDGSLQVTYGGHPLYYYEDDKTLGDVTGQDKKEYGAEWYLVKPSGDKMGDVEEKE